MNIELATSTASTITAYVSGFIGDFAVYITLIIGVILSLYIIGKLIDMLRPDSERLPQDSDII